MKIKSVFVISFLLLIISFFYAFSDFSGYIENITAIYDNKDKSFTDVATARIEYSLEYENRGGIELYSIISKRCT